VSDWKSTLVDCYMKRQGVASGQFTMTGGGTTDFYIDGRRVTTYPPGLRAVTAGMVEMIRAHALFPTGANLVAPVLSGIPVATALSLELNVPFIMDRGQQKKHGLGQRFEGLFTDSRMCLVVDDLITVGTTVTQTIVGLREVGKEVHDVLVVVDREEGASEVLASLGVKLHVLITQNDLKDAWKIKQSTIRMAS
jgi:orotate phosphoribosyltransferase